jgi:2-polyprenyl-3-methyl-5-hydroxy-6-metoxy-1,4-benzoquinol methylase
LSEPARETADPISREAAIERIVARYGHWRHRRYVRGKLIWDPIFEAAVPLFAGSVRPLLDIGCGLGLLGQYLRERGVRAPYLGVDLDGAKIEEARAAAASGALDIGFATVDASSLPPFGGDVALIDVLHYLPQALQREVLANAAARVVPGGMLVIRNVLRDESWRFRITVAEEKIIAVLGWMRFATGYFPRREDIEAPLAALGFDLCVEPLWGRTPFNSYLIVARRAA